MAEATRRGAARLLTALAVLLPAAQASGAAVSSRRPAGGIGARRALVGEDVAVGFRGRLQGPILRRLQEGLDECTSDTSVGDAEAGIGIYEDEEACDREGPLVGCNGEWCVGFT